MRHAGVLRALARYQKHDRPIALHLAACEQPRRIAHLKHAQGISLIAADQRTSLAERAPPDVQRVGDIGQRLIGVRAQMRGQAIGGGFERGRRFGRDQQQLPIARRPR